MIKKNLILFFLILNLNLFSQDNNYKTKEEARIFMNKKLETIKSIFRVDKNYFVYTEIKTENDFIYSSVEIKKVFISMERRGDFAFNLAVNCATGDCWKQKTKKGIITFFPGSGELMTNKELKDAEQIIEAFQFIQTKIMGYAPTKIK